MKLRRIPIGGWTRCVHDAAPFDSEGEFRAACLLDSSETVEWWLRNDPPIFRIATPAGSFEPDFIYRRTGDGLAILEIKGDIFWDAEGSIARIKSRSACAWVSAIEASAHTEKWTFALVIDQDAISAQTLEGMLATAREASP